MNQLETAIKAVQMYAETHPRPVHVSQAQACEMLDISAPTLLKLIRKKQINLNAAGRIPITEIDKFASGLND